MQLSQAILPVAGYGTRFLPWTKVVPKELLPIGNRPLIAVLVDEAMSVGIRDICFVISRGKEKIPEFFKTDEALEKVLADRGKSHLLEELTKYHEVKFTTVYQDEMKGDGHAILQAKDWVQSDHLAIIFGDEIIAGSETGLQELSAALSHVASNDAGMLCLHNVPKEKVSKYGIVKTGKSVGERMHTITGLVEKPQPEDAPSTLAVVGKYIIPKSTIVELAKVQGSHKDGEIRLIDAMKSQIDAGTMQLYGYEVQGRRFDTGTPEGYREAVLALG
ncbi:MAG: sugar phosphate nucleotidyltransferase [Candidatus Peribacteraceae bacterium]